MIPKREILELAQIKGVEPRIIEKDYVLGWLLVGINEHPALKAKWIFKGGTALKKCYFNDYRFSEDLDFTVLDVNHINQEFLQNTFKNILENVIEQSGIDFEINATKFDIHPDKNEGYVTGSVYYRGPLGLRGSLSKVLLDILNKEILSLGAHERKIYHDYSDYLADNFFSYCYCLEELFAEKLRALADRARPRDLYDAISIYKLQGAFINKVKLISALKDKCAFKNIPMPTVDSILHHNKFNELKEEWANMLKHQVPNLSDIEMYLNELSKLFKWLEK